LLVTRNSTIGANVGQEGAAHIEAERIHRRATSASSALFRAEQRALAARSLPKVEGIDEALAA
jgi:hypothetical protein